MAKGTNWTLTSMRKAKVMELLGSQWTLSAIATEFGVSTKTITKALKANKINHKAVRMSGLNRLRADTFNSIGSINDDYKRVDAGLKYLDRYAIDEDTTIDTDGSKSKIKDIAKEILSELND